MFFIAEPKSASSSLAYTLARIFKAKCINGFVTKQKIYCDDFTELQRFHNTMNPRSAKFLYRFCGGIRNVYKEHLLPTEEHLEILRNFKYPIVILLRKSKDVIDCYKRFDEIELKNKWGRKGILYLDKIKEDVELFYDRYMELKKEDYKHLLFITYKDLVLEFTKTLKKIFKHYGYELPENYKDIQLRKVKYTGVGIDRLLEKPYKVKLPEIAKENEGVNIVINGAVNEKEAKEIANKIVEGMNNATDSATKERIDEPGQNVSEVDRDEGD